MTETLMRTLISGPGVYDDMPDAIYHSDPTPDGSLSRSGAREILPPKTPAHFAWWRENGRAPKRVFDFGHVAHARALGRGLDVAVVDADDWKLKKHQEERKAAYADGKAPILRHESDTIDAMVAALRADKRAAPLFDLDRVKVEQSLFWTHARTKTMCRSRPDILLRTSRGDYIAADYKTAEHADAEAFGKSSADYGYHLQEWFTLEGLRALGLDEAPRMVWVVQEKRPPHLVNVVQLTAKASSYGRLKGEQAVTIYARCQAEGRWPGYGPGIELADLPGWVTYGEDLAL